MSERAAAEQAVFLVGGLGTRLGDLTRHAPKPLMMVAGRPFLAWLVEAVASQGIRNFLFLSGHLASQVEVAMAGFSVAGLTLDYSTELEPLGTGGALLFARPKLAQSFYLLNGDSLFDVPLADLVSAGGSPDQPLARLALRLEDDAGRYGSVELKDGRIAGFAEKRQGAGPGLINGGVYWMRRSILDAVPSGAFSLERDLFPALAAAGRLEGRIFEAPFIDIGIPASLQAAQTIVPIALARLSG